MAIAETSTRNISIGLIAHSRAGKYQLLFSTADQVAVNRVGGDKALEQFRAGLEVVDRYPDDGLPYHIGHTVLRNYVDFNYRGRSVITRRGDHFIAATVLEPLADHPLYDPAATDQLYFEAHNFYNSVEDYVSPTSIFPPRGFLINPFLQLGETALLR